VAVFLSFSFGRRTELVAVFFLFGSCFLLSLLLLLFAYLRLPLRLAKCFATFNKINLFAQYKYIKHAEPPSCRVRLSDISIFVSRFAQKLMLIKFLQVAWHFSLFTFAFVGPLHPLSPFFLFFIFEPQRA